VASAQDEGDLPVHIVVIKPRQVYLVPGGQTKSIRLQGTGFESVNKVEALAEGGHKAKLHVELKTISWGIYTLLISAEADATPGSDYRIRLRGKTEFRKLPLDITVIDPKNPPTIPRYEP